MEIISKKCVNSNWIAKFLSEKGQECCECFGECKVKVKNNRGYEYILTEGEIRTLEKFEAEEKESNRLDLRVMPLLIKDEISQKLVDRLNMFERQMTSNYGFANKEKIAHKINELKKCIKIVQSA